MSDERRVFIAVPIPGGARRAISEANRQLELYLSTRPRWVPEENLHITLMFLGNRPSKEIELAKQACEKAACVEPFTAHTGTIGCFPGNRRARVMWVGLTNGERLAEIYSTLYSYLSDKLEIGQTAAFHPHITIARFRRPGPVDLESINANVRIEENFPVESLALFESVLHPAGAKYALLEEFRLRV